jgi:hypothetical protein
MEATFIASGRQNFLTPQAKHALSLLLQMDPKERATPTQILSVLSMEKKEKERIKNEQSKQNRPERTEQEGIAGKV